MKSVVRKFEVIDPARLSFLMDLECSFFIKWWSSAQGSSKELFFYLGFSGGKPRKTCRYLVHKFTSLKKRRLAMKATRNVLGCLSLNVIQFSIRKFSENLILTSFYLLFYTKIGTLVQNINFIKMWIFGQPSSEETMKNFIFRSLFFDLEFWKTP